MSNLCNHCGICCKLIPVDFESKTLLRDGFQPLSDEFFDNLIPLTFEEAQNINEFYVEKVRNTFPNSTFFRCKFLSPTNECTKLEIPDICQKYPSHPFALIPDECGHYGEIFILSEETKQRVRKYKEEIIYYESYINEDPRQEKIYSKIITSLKRFIDKYSAFGSDNW